MSAFFSMEAPNAKPFQRPMSKIGATILGAIVGGLASAGGIVDLFG